jgi:hypothetical protein
VLSDLLGTEPLTPLQTLAAVGPALVPAALVVLVRRLR